MTKLVVAAILAVAGLMALAPGAADAHDCAPDPLCYHHNGYSTGITDSKGVYGNLRTPESVVADDNDTIYSRVLQCGYANCKDAGGQIDKWLEIGWARFTNGTTWIYSFSPDGCPDACFELAPGPGVGQKKFEVRLWYSGYNWVYVAQWKTPATGLWQELNRQSIGSSWARHTENFVEVVTADASHPYIGPTWSMGASVQRCNPNCAWVQWDNSVPSALNQVAPYSVSTETPFWYWYARVG